MGRKKSKNRTFKSASKIPLKAFTEAVTASSAVLPPPPPPSPPWIDLPGDLTANILGRLGPEEILRSAQSVCATWWKICQDPAMWRVICFLNLQRNYSVHSIMCRRAVDRSQGQLVDLTLDYGDDVELMKYIVQRSSSLKRLTLYSWVNLSVECLAEAVKRLPQLEELHLTIRGVEAGDIKNIGISCPKLKSFSYNERDSRVRFPREEDDDAFEGEEEDDFLEGFDPNEHALAIGKSMPNLRHLQLLANCMQNPGLEAILNGCPHLESLDIRLCFELNLEGDVWKRCRDQIKDLKLPSDWISHDVFWPADYPFGYSSHECDSSSYESEREYDFNFDDEYETYDDYTSPYGFEFFDNDKHALINPKVFDPDYF